MADRQIRKIGVGRKLMEDKCWKTDDGGQTIDGERTGKAGCKQPHRK